MSERAQRFSKAKVREALARRMDIAEANFYEFARKKIDPGNGYAQCRGLDGLAWMHYGQWVAARDLLAALEEGCL